MRLKKLLGDLLIMTRGERNGVLVLLLLIVVALLIRYVGPSMLDDDQHYLDSIDEKINQLQAQKDALAKNEIEFEGLRDDGGAQAPDMPRLLFPFNPNLLPFDSLLMLGIPERTARTLVKYREKGGKFYQQDDLLKIYGFDSVLFQKLQPFVSIIEVKESRKITADAARFVPAKEPAGETWYLEINSADSAEWTRLPGVGPVYAKRICSFRKALGGFMSIEQLKEVYKFPPETYALILPSLTIDTTKVTSINLNFADVKALMRHPYCDLEAAKSIVAYRSVKGPYVSVSQLLTDSVLSAETYHRFSVYLRVSP
ncbi:MAG: helix-hairpin-helix domain-containing protein [Prolixibacteraceae bacterium]|nr:helix-hairpin-helix domain-containing protein [Prolixibacteraceae bacterium]